MARTTKTVQIRIQGVKQLQRAFAYMGPMAIGALGIAINDEINEILMESRDLVPIDTGALWDSGRTEDVPEGTSSALAKSGPSKGVLEGFIVYGDEDVEYAAAVHERLDVSHTAPRQAKFLEVVCAAREHGFAKKLAIIMWAHLEFVSNTSGKWSVR